MIELHDATGEWHRLGELVDYWTEPTIVRIIKRYARYLLVNIGNEVGNDRVNQELFINGYTAATQRMREAGIHTPLVIDAPGLGQEPDDVEQHRCSTSCVGSLLQRRLLSSSVLVDRVRR